MLRLFGEANFILNVALGWYRWQDRAIYDIIRRHRLSKPSDSTVIARAPCQQPVISPAWRKRCSLLLLILQNTGVIVAMRSSRTVRPGKLMYISATAVVCAEVMKLCASFCFVVHERGGLAGAIRHLRPHVIAFASPEMLQLVVPGLLYALQNNLLFISLSNLSGAMHQVSYQLKILTTAMLSVLVLGKSVSRTQWLALLGLTGGVMLIQVPQGDHRADSIAGGSTTLGLTAILGACITSGFAGVYTERLMKKSEASIWVRNVQLAIIGTVMGLVAAYAHNGVQIRTDGFFQGYDALVWCVVVWNAIGGIIISMVMKYADNILKCFASALSIVLTCLISFCTGEFTPNVMFMLGTILVIASSSVYGGVPKVSLVSLAGRMHVLQGMVRSRLRKKQLQCFALCQV